MAAIITVLFFVFLLLLLCALVALVRPRWLHLKTRKEAAQSAGFFFVVLLILGPFLPDTDSAPEPPQTESTQVAQPVCEDLPDRLKRLECAYQRALEAHADSNGRLSMEHARYLTTACPPCEDILDACVHEWVTRNPGDIAFESLLMPPAEFERCMDQAWPPAVWPHYENLPSPKIPPELAAYMQAIQQRRHTSK